MHIAGWMVSQVCDLGLDLLCQCFRQTVYFLLRSPCVCESSSPIPLTVCFCFFIVLYLLLFLCVFGFWNYRESKFYVYFVSKITTEKCVWT